MVSAAVSDGRIAWFPNSGNGDFGPRITLTTSAADARSVFPVDLDGDGDVDFTLTSTDFEMGGIIPTLHHFQGGNVSPALAWVGAPEGTLSFGVYFHDLDFQPQGFPNIHFCDGFGPQTGPAVARIAVQKATILGVSSPRAPQTHTFATVSAVAKVCV